MNQSNLAFVDTETTGLDPDRHEIWEVGLIVDEVEHRWFLDVDISKADPFALLIGRYHERHPWGYRYHETHPDPGPHEPRAFPTYRNEDGKRDGYSASVFFVQDFVRLTYGRHLVGAVVSFDEERLRKLLLRHGTLPCWHYHLVDVEALVAGKLGIAPPWTSTALSDRLGVDPEQFDRHTALGDARWAKAMYESVMPDELVTSGDA